MDYEKIGKFIAECRRNANLTQKDLAIKLNITDRAVSRWERGKGCPDVSLLEPLSNELGVSVLSLLRGEESQDDNDIVVLDILKDNKKKTKKWKVISFVFLNMLLFILGMIFIFDIVLPFILKGSKDVTIYVETGWDMEPTLKYGDQLYFRSVNIEDVSIGDIVLVKYAVYEYRETELGFSGYPAVIKEEEEKKLKGYRYSARRVFQKLQDDEGVVVLKTKGDRNMMVDSEEVGQDNLVGTLQFRVPLVGGVYTYDYDMENYFVSKWVTFFVTIGIVSIVFLDIVYIRKCLDRSYV